MPGPPVLNGPFTMPMMNSFVPRRMQPWIYLCIAIIFQLTGLLYMGSMSQMAGEMNLMREDILMITFCNVVGVNMPFPLLFRMKFRFTNRQLLLNAAIIIAICNIIAIHTTFVPLLCLLSYIAGYFKLCGTFECASNIQLWMTPKRDFRIFFPLLYIIVLGDIGHSSFLSGELTYISGSWKMMNILIIGLLLIVILFVYTCTHNFRFMKPMLFISLDWLGCLLWSALMIEIIFLFNYGEYYNWTDGAVWRIVAFSFPITLILCIGRMLNIHHPFIAPECFCYKKLFPLLGMFVVAEMINATGNTLFTPFASGVLGYGYLTQAHFNFVAWLGTVCGCLFTFWWLNILKQKYTRLLTVGILGMLVYLAYMYFIISPDINIEKLYLPIILRNAGYAIFFTTLTVYLEELMPFQHFFMGLTITGFIRNGVCDSICSGCFSHGLKYHILDNINRWSWIYPFDPAQTLMVSIKQMFGYCCMFGTILLLFFMLWDIQPIRSTVKKIPYWNIVGKAMRKAMRRR